MLLSDASILPDQVARKLTVPLLDRAASGEDHTLRPLLASLNQTHTPNPGTNLRLVYEILPAHAVSDARTAGTNSLDPPSGDST